MHNDTSAADIHFYLDNVPPQEAFHVLRVLSIDHPLSPRQIAQELERAYGFRMQKDVAYTPRRLFDLGLALQTRVRGNTVYSLTNMGSKLQTMLTIDPALAADLLHYCHYTGYQGRPQDRKNLWSYRRCCEIIWQEGVAVAPKDLAARIQGEMRDSFPEIDLTARQGARFDATAARRLMHWLSSLTPDPLPEPKGRIKPRTVEHFQLVLLALDDVYRARGYRYGDPVLLDDGLIYQAAGVFFLDLECSARLIRTAARISNALTITDTLGGPAVNLLRPYTIADV